MRERAGQAEKAGFAGGIGGHGVVDDIAQHRGDVHDRAFRLREQRPRRHRQPHHAVEIDVHHVEKVGFLIFLLRLGDARGVDQRIEARKPTDESVDRFPVTHVEQFEANAFCLAVGACGVEPLLVTRRSR